MAWSFVADTAFRQSALLNTKIIADSFRFIERRDAGMQRNDAWGQAVLKTRCELLNGANLCRQISVQAHTGAAEKFSADRMLWKEPKIGDHLVRDTGREPHSTGFRVSSHEACIV